MNCSAGGKNVLDFVTKRTDSGERKSGFVRHGTRAVTLFRLAWRRLVMRVQPEPKKRHNVMIERELDTV